MKKFKEKWKALPKLTRAIIRLSTKIVVIASIALLLFNFIIGIGIVHDTMNFPSIKDGDVVLTYRLGEYRQDDLVQYKFNGKTYYGRIVALEDETVEISEEHYLINGSIPFEQLHNLTLPAENSDVTYPFTVQKDKAFILADYRENGAVDSRSFGDVSLDDITGKVIFVFRSRGI